MKGCQTFGYRRIKITMPTSTTKLVKKAMFVVAAMLFLSIHTDRATGQSVSLVMEQATVQRECAALAKAAAASGHPPDVMTAHPRCRPHVLTPRDEIWLAIALGLASAALGWGLLTGISGRGRKG